MLVLITLLAKNRFYLSRLHPYNAVVVFKDSCVVTLREKKRFCIFLDVVRLLVFRSELKQEANHLSLFGQLYDGFTLDQFMKILTENITQAHGQLHFSFNKIRDVEALSEVLNKLDEKKIYSLFAAAERLKDER